jgi:hypothetical protein
LKMLLPKGESSEMGKPHANKMGSERRETKS